MMAANSIDATLSLRAAAESTWDIAAIGAGPAGSSAAIALAGRGLSILLIDKADFPRWKVCGCCINAAALDSLHELGVGELPHRLGARRLTELSLGTGRRRATIPLASSVSLSRSAFDAGLLRHAIARGVAFLPGTHASLALHEKEDVRCVELTRGGQRETIAARLVLAADGLGSHLLDSLAELGGVIETSSRIGAGAVVADAPPTYRDGVIHMACGRHGYVGLVRLEDGQLDIATALDPAFAKTRDGPAGAVAAILAEANFPPIDRLDEQAWRGTPKLTRRRARLGAERLLVLGDAAGYVEPFTGEGIAWALASGLAIAPLTEQAVQNWSSDLVRTWELRHAVLIGRRQRTCRVVTGVLRSASLTRAAVAVLSLVPGVAVPFVRAMGS